MSLYPESIIEEIVSSDTIILSTHVSPDPDAIGSAGGLCLALRSIGKNALLYLPDPLPERLRGFFPEEYILKDIPSSGYLLIGLDCATKKRLGDESLLLCSSARRVINIDHHASNEGWGDLNHIIGDEAATAILVYELLTQLKLNISAQVATLLYAGIMDDTGSFRFSNTSEKALLTASSLLALGANPSEIATEVYFQEPLRALKLKGKAIDTLSVFEDGKAALAYISLDMRGDDVHSPGDSEGIIDIVRAVKGISIALFLRENERDKWRGSIRSKSISCDVSNFASIFGGGGHHVAAGFSIDGTRDEVLSRVKHEVHIFLKLLKTR
jgi:bifunctional oligoribonuclease and PAP phosphatase NrnA